MAKRNRAALRERRKAREQEKKQQRIVQISAVMVTVLVLGMIGFFALRAGNSGPAVAQERLDLDPILGNPDAPITITEYSAFGCHACRSWHESGIVEQILAQYPNDVKFVYRDMPIIDAAWSQSMAEIAQCALDQGNDQFWVAHDTLFEDTVQGRTGQSDAIDLVINNSSTIDGDALRECVNNNTHFQTVRYDMERPEAQSIRGTPTWFVNNQRLYSASPQAIIDLIEAELNS
ncbi:MAG: thioredoxin domain-containing protein [Chloroflexota bacterium]